MYTYMLLYRMEKLSSKKPHMAFALCGTQACTKPLCTTPCAQVLPTSLPLNATCQAYRIVLDFTEALT